MRQRLAAVVRGALDRAVQAGTLPPLPEGFSVVIEKPRSPEHGDFATNVAMTLARHAKKAPRAIAEAIVEHLEGSDELRLSSSEVAGPGFLNFRLHDDEVRAVIRDVRRAGAEWGRSPIARGERVLVEFVSANPTGPLHVGHGRGAVHGDAVASLLEAVGYDVEREYYINDVGNQMEILGRSLHARVLEHLGAPLRLPEGGYQGEYLKEIARSFVREYKPPSPGVDFDDAREAFIGHARDAILAGIRTDLAELGIEFDTWFPERRLHRSGRINASVESLKDKGVVFEQEGALVFRSTDFGDEKDRVVVRGDGRTTYFAADIAYHLDKLERGFDTAIDIWGADHHGYVARVKAALQASGADPERLEIELIQFVSLLRDGEQVKMSTRSGEFVELREILDEVGADAVRFFFLMRKGDSQLEFDLELAKKRSMDNPVFYVQYGHARLCSILRKAAELDLDVNGDLDDDVLERLTLPEERAICLMMAEYPHVLARAAHAREPHQVVFYLTETVRTFHSYYTRYKGSEKVIGDDPVTTAARLALVDALRIVLASGLELLGVAAPEVMESLPEEAESADEAAPAEE